MGKAHPLPRGAFAPHPSPLEPSPWLFLSNISRKRAHAGARHASAKSGRALADAWRITLYFNLESLHSFQPDFELYYSVYAAIAQSERESNHDNLAISIQHKIKDAAVDREISEQKAIVDEQEALIRQIQADLSELRSQTVETETAIKNINGMLVDAGFQGFEVRPRKERIETPDGRVEYVEQNPVINYEVVRTDTGEIAKDLSEGEKNFIAFLYFQQRVFGSSSAEGDAGQKIVVIDDPVSSMDSGALFIIGEQIRKMVEICRNNADNRNPVVKGNFIKQLFVLTHNAYFHRELSVTCQNGIVHWLFE